MISVEVNQKAHHIAPETTLNDLVSKLEIQTNGIAIAINNKVIKKTEWHTQTLHQNDAILIITSTQGG
jgi:sulfur carrier protein